jgi:hypothetical protein
MTGATWLAIGLLTAAPEPITLSIDRCSHLDTAEVKRLLAIELSAELVEGDGDASIRCEETRVHLAYRTKTRTLDLARTDARAQPRLIALALAELAVTPVPPPPRPPETPSIPERVELPVEPPVEPPLDPPIAPEIPPPPPVTPPPPPEPPPAPPALTAAPPVTTSTATELHFAASVTGGLMLFTSPGPPAFGGRATVEIAPIAFGARLDAGAYFGSESVDPGSVSLLLADVGLSGFGRFGGDVVLFDVGVGARLGFARLRGSPDASEGQPGAIEGATLTGAWAGPFLGGRATFRLEPLLIVADLEAGLVIRPVVGNAEGTTVVSADGAWFGFHLGLGLEP